MPSAKLEKKAKRCEKSKDASKSSVSKRKSKSKDSNAAAMDLLRAHFESQFAPLESKKTEKKKSKKRNSRREEDSSEDERIFRMSEDGDTDMSDADTGSDDTEVFDEDDDWEGFSSDGEDLMPQPEVVDLSQMNVAPAPKLTAKALKTLLATDDKPKPTTKPSNAGDDDADEALNIKNDLALQRLLRESHLLDNDLEATGKNRLKALESRIESVGGKDLRKQKAPMAIAKGIKKAAETKEEKRRRQAKEAGIILEKATKKKSDVVRRERGVGAPSVGKFKNGALIIGKKELAAMSGSKSSNGKAGKRRK